MPTLYLLQYQSQEDQKTHGTKNRSEQYSELPTMNEYLKLKKKNSLVGFCFLLTSIDI